jgi:hypothetical protein
MNLPIRVFPFPAGFRRLWLLVPLAVLSVVIQLACFPDPPADPNLNLGLLDIKPKSVSVQVGTKVPFHASYSVGFLTWSAAPASVGTINQDGVFTATGPGVATITLSVYLPFDIPVPPTIPRNQTVQASILVLPVPVNAEIGTELAPGWGQFQSTGGGAVSNTALAGGPVIGEARDSSQNIVIRHGFTPPIR